MNNFFEFIGRICFVLCEVFCILNIIDNLVIIKMIECVIVDWGWKEGWIKLCVLKEKIGKKVVVVGFGLVGLVCV